VDVGSSYLPSDILAAFLYAQMENAEQIIAKRNLIFDQYMEGLRPLANTGRIRLPLVIEDSRCNGHLFYIVTQSLKERTELISFLAQRGIYAVFHYVPLHTSPAGRRFGRVHGSLKVTEAFSDCLLRLPLYYEMMQEDVQRVISTIEDFYRQG